jgi:protein-histidine pros-kinase
VRPAARLAAIADQVSTGKLDAPELKVTGKDEISALAGSFNRMRLSLEKAMKMLEEQ